MSEKEKKLKEIKGGKLLSQSKVAFVDPLPDVHTAALPIAGCVWVDTTEGVVLIDTLIRKKSAMQVREKIKDKVKYIIYTHGHGDHVGGTEVFLGDKPEIIASKYLPDRFDKYRMLAKHRGHSRAIQFNTPEVSTFSEYVYPTKTFLGEMTIKLGDKTFELHTTRAETDDAVWVHVPEIKAAIIGDLIIGVFPNIGNPWKPTRFALDWAKTLEEIRALDLNLLLCSGGSIIYKGRKVHKALDANIEAIRTLHDQVIDFINQGMHVSEMIHAVKLPEHLRKSPYLLMRYSRPEFFVFNVYRWYHGYFDNNPAHLLPRPEKEVNSEIFNLIGNSEKILRRAKELLTQDKAQLALQVLDTLIQADPENIDARKLRIELLKVLGANDYCLMSRNSWVYFIEKDKGFLKSKGEL